LPAKVRSRQAAGACQAPCVPVLLPPSPEWAEGRHGERAVWEALPDQLPDEAALVYSVWLVEEHREYEADLVVAWPGVGVCVLEVKGGRVERDGVGRWFQTKAGQTPRPMSNPMTQASDCRHVLQCYLTSQCADAARSRTAHVVAYPTWVCRQRSTLPTCGVRWSWTRRTCAMPGPQCLRR
jgi:hypothetical protein